MQKPDFKSLKGLISAIHATNNGFISLYSEKTAQEAEIHDLCMQIAGKKAREELDAYSIEELKNAKAGIRVSALQEAGYTTLGQIAGAKDIQLMAIDGIGEKQVEAIKHVITDFANSLSTGVVVRLDAENMEDGTNKALIISIARYMRCEKVRIEAQDAAAKLYEFTAWLDGQKIITNGFKWVFSGTNAKQNTLEVEHEAYQFCNGTFFARLLNILSSYQTATLVTPEEAFKDFATNAASFYSLLEKLGSARGNRAFVYDSIPAELAEEVNGITFDLSGFIGNLRGYQEFGTKYIINQKKVLLGDEMGLGKTIQAIAAMAHIEQTEREKHHFLIVCPASVIINWAREISKFTRIETYILHGSMLRESFEAWTANGGAAITNYESMGKIVDGIDNKMHLSMLVIDEAHYIKNPDAQRTMYIRRLDNESERILLMTGTPLENRVEEMCNLIDFVRPDMVKEVRALAHMTHLPEFREKLSPVYLRRTRSKVLQELPEIDEKQEWCEMTASDKSEYVSALTSGNFATMRKVSFLGDDVKRTAKGIRLLELCNEAADEHRKVIVYSFFRETVSKVSTLLNKNCIGTITGDTKIEQRQLIIDEFTKAKDGAVLVCQIQAGGVGLNIQAASIVIFCEPQIKPSLTWQALSRVYRMGQIRNVLVYHLLCPGTVDEEMVRIFEEKKIQFESFADESAVADAFDNVMDKEWIQKLIQHEKEKYLPMVI